MSDKARKISLEGFLKMLRKAGRGHKNGLLHYTTMPSFKSMIDSRKVYFSLLNSSNDKGECNDNRHYMMCFTYGIEENVGLWGIYGVPRKECIRLKFPNRDIIDWIESAKKNELQYYGVRNRGNPVLLKDVSPKVLICDVAYYAGENGNIFTHDGTNYRVTNGRTGYKPCRDPRLSPYVKQWAWSYEREVRIVLEFDEPVRNSMGQPFRRLAVDFEEPLDALLEGKGEIRLGPWFGRGRENVWKRDFPNAFVVESVFANSERKIIFRTPCQEMRQAETTEANVVHVQKTTGVAKAVLKEKEMKKVVDSDIEFKESGMDYVNPKAKVVIVGITPGNSQMEASRRGKSKKEIKRENAFAGGMRPKLVEMLNSIGVNKLLGIKSCDTLWSDDFDKVQMTSLLRDATYKGNEMYRGFPSVLNTPKLKAALMDGFVKHDCRKCKAAKLYVALGPKVNEVLEWLKEKGIITAPIVTIPHASSANRGRIAVFLKKRSPEDSNTAELRAAEMRGAAKKTVSKLLAS